MTTSPNSSLNDLLSIMARLRDPEDGCEWDLAQDFASIAPYTIEEAYEVADAIDRQDMEDLQSELGDLLLQVVFHARIAEEQGAFAICDVIKSICEKMIRRHPHIFAADGATDPVSVERRWEEIKATERGASGALDGVARALPALLRAQKIQKRAARVGFDWPDISGAREKITEELAEVETAITPADVQEEIGDLLFSVVNYARHHGVDAEAALKSATEKFEGRFRIMEDRSTQDLASLDAPSLDDLWIAAKEVQRASRS
ncbi:nucleoside triphosphate pyrophosphohydrolase [Novosphingopyxis baekryungensis]|uniref:nucleoside triphosphate pyrophosphohydrolase n=1 Tax=Novosphingopyxis baekryungensis TaxID=279369 RepID=UPI0003B53D51|nr:nucleoside triphosphate pyrophosphohydrolase [Novosphingopyxis baekryungensis]